MPSIRKPGLPRHLSASQMDGLADFVKENVAAFVNMTPETFSGV
jgi:hypothetical protein